MDEQMISHAEAAKMSGLEFLQKMLAGEVSRPSIAATLGFALVRADLGEVEFQGSVPLGALNPFGFAHGGWFGAILDSALGCAVQSRLKPGQMYTTLEYKVNIMRPLRPDGVQVRAIGTTIHVGRTTGIAEARLIGVEDGKTYAIGTTTCAIIAIDAR